MAFTKFRFMNAQEQIVNVFAGTLTFYLVATAWSAARRKDGETDIFDWGALLAALAVGVGMLTYGLEAAHSQTGLKFGYPAALYFVWASVALLSAAGDACCSLAAVFSSLWTSIDASTNFPFGIDSKYTSVPIPFTTVRSCLPA